MSNCLIVNHVERYDGSRLRNPNRQTQGVGVGGRVGKRTLSIFTPCVVRMYTETKPVVCRATKIAS